ncbi:neprosin family prolyl endopeptidase [Nocardioides sp. zg-1228]|nr:neprosin family prolyl endopeptidase [Nocardioides sp. zg-1228]
MRAHLVDLYADTEAEVSFEDPAGRVVDCIPIEEQPSLKGTGASVATPPDLRPVLQGRSPQVGEELPLSPADFSRRDRHGNRVRVPAGTIPVHRVTLADLTRFNSLDDFVRKEPGPLATPPGTPDANTANNHRYAYTIQTVNCVGAHNSMALYSPAINTDQIFSLSQHWYAAGSGDAHQTLEVGWQVYPEKYGHAHPVLFIYWTADNYKTTGAYNLDKPGFVQTNSAWTIGGALSPVSVKGGVQMELEVTTYLFQNNWWIYLGGTAPANALGYYPTTLYAGGQLASGAQEILFGGETVTRAVSWPGMGSGEFASAGWQQAAYHRNIYYYPPGGGAQWTALSAQQPSPACYTLSLSAAAAPWGVYFFYGGTGGGNC